MVARLHIQTNTPTYHGIPTLLDAIRFLNQKMCFQSLIVSTI